MSQNQPNGDWKAESFMYRFHLPLVQGCFSCVFFCPLDVPVCSSQSPSLQKKVLRQRRKTAIGPYSEQPSEDCELSVASNKLRWANEKWSRHQWCPLFIWCQAPSQILGWKSLTGQTVIPHGLYAIYDCRRL